MIAAVVPSLDEARELGDRGMDSAAANAARRGFSTEEVARIVVQHLVDHGPTPGEDLVLIAKSAGHVPHDDRAFGAVFAGLSRREKIVCVKYVPRRRGHGTAGGRVWGLAQ